jgi:hypothetical protein
MGGGSIGSSSNSDFQDIEKRAMDRLRKMSADQTSILFVCEKADVASLGQDLKANGLDGDPRVHIAPFGDPVALADAVRKATLVVAYTKDATSTAFVDGTVETAFQQKKPGLHVKGKVGSKIPGKVAAYRWRSMAWDEFAKLLE